MPSLMPFAPRRNEHPGGALVFSPKEAAVAPSLGLGLYCETKKCIIVLVREKLNRRDRIDGLFGFGSKRV